MIRNRCPKCGGRIIVSDLYQYSMDYVVLKKPAGELSKNAKKRDAGPMEVMIAGCENPDCDAFWESDDFYISDDCFYDEKYVGEDCE